MRMIAVRILNLSMLIVLLGCEPMPTSPTDNKPKSGWKVLEFRDCDFYDQTTREITCPVRCQFDEGGNEFLKETITGTGSNSTDAFNDALNKIKDERCTV